MALAIIGSPANITINNNAPSATFTPGAGASHIIVAMSYHVSDGDFVSAVSIGGNSFSKLINAEQGGNDFSESEIWYCAGFTGSNLTVSVSRSGTWKDFALTIISVSGGVTPTVSDTDTHMANTNASCSVSCAVGDLIVFAATSSDHATASSGLSNGFTSAIDQAMPNNHGRAVIGYKIAASTTESQSTQLAGGSASHTAAMAMAVIPTDSPPAGSDSRLLLLGVG